MPNTSSRSRLDDGVTFVGILLGFVVGVVVMLLRVKNRGEVNRKNLTQFGVGTIEQDISSSLAEAKQQAQERASDA